VREKTRSSAELGAAWEAVRLTANHLLAQPPVVYRKEGRRLLGRSREALSRMMHLGFAFRVTGDRVTSSAASRDQAITAMPDGILRTLDTAEMTMALAVRLRLALPRAPARRSRARSTRSNPKGWSYLKPGSNHARTQPEQLNQVCHAGMVAARLPCWRTYGRRR
jgi:hypothetical protein